MLAACPRVTAPCRPSFAWLCAGRVAKPKPADPPPELATSRVSQYTHLASMKNKNESDESDAKFPYCTKPSSLRKFLAMVPQKPKPATVNQNLLKSWGFNTGNDYSMVRVLKKVGLVGADNTPTPDYVAFMHKGNGPAHLAQNIRRLYSPLFEVSHAPHKETTDVLENLFNIHSGGGSGTKAFQIQTFKALCDHADFSGNGTASTAASVGIPGSRAAPEIGRAGSGGPTIHIDLHIHLPGNKSRRDYEYMFEDIARYIYGKVPQGAEPTEPPQ